MTDNRITKIEFSSDNRGWCDHYAPGNGATIWRNRYRDGVIVSSDFVRYATLADVRKHEKDTYNPLTDFRGES